jgi:hypothetical protein
MDYDDVSLALGARYELASGLFLAGSCTEFLNVPRDNRGKSTHPTHAAPSNGPDAGGQYAEWVLLVNLDIELIF